jgi:hypothetical protein
MTALQQDLHNLRGSAATAQPKQTLRHEARQCGCSPGGPLPALSPVHADTHSIKSAIISQQCQTHVSRGLSKHHPFFMLRSHPSQQLCALYRSLLSFLCSIASECNWPQPPLLLPHLLHGSMAASAGTAACCLAAAAGAASVSRCGCSTRICSSKTQQGMHSIAHGSACSCFLTSGHQQISCTDTQSLLVAGPLLRMQGAAVLRSAASDIGTTTTQHNYTR